jgi:flagellar hook-associated protein 1 FlgK
VASTFGGIELGASALNAARYGLDVVSQNIANADTPGYVRQASQQATVDGPAGVPAIYTAPAGPGGVRVVATSRLNDPVIDARVRTEQSRQGLADTTASQLSLIEGVFPEPSDTGLSEQLNDFWNAWGSVANDPGSAAPRSVLLQKAATVSGTLNAMSTSLTDIANGTAQQLGQDAAAATSAAGQLASVNAQIAVATASGENANSLLDQRDVLLGTLSSLVGGTAVINANGTADVSVGGQALVTGATSVAVAVGAGNQVTVGGTAVALSGGSAGGEVTALTTTIPHYQGLLDTVANTLSSTVNTAQAAGYDLSGAPGTPLFSGAGAAGITVAIANPSLIAASATPGGNLDGSNALAASGLGRSAAGADAAYTALVGDIGSASKLAQQQQSTQDAVTASVTALRTSATGVSTDEEVSHMLTYQYAFGAASRVLTTMDSTLDTLINHTGVVGRA